MASDAEIDLLVNASNALRDLERDLDRLVNQAEASADPVLIAATLDRTLALRNMRRELDEAIRVAQAGAPDIRVRADVDIDDNDIGRVNNLKVGLLTLGAVAGRSLGPLAGLAGGLAKVGAAAGTAVPLLAGAAAATESILPAAALATSGLLTLGLASATVKIAMVGVGDAIKGAFDPDTDPEDLAKAMEKLGPHARSFVKELSGMRKGFKAIQIDVQNRLFANLDKSLERTAKAVLPSLHGALDRSADSLNDMARGAAEAAQGLGESGILGKALAHSTGALSKLERIPGQAVTAFGQLAAASGPALEGLATRAGGVADRIAAKLSKAFESGALEKAINQAVANIDQLGRIAGNVFSGIGNIINAVSVDGQGLFSTLEKVTQAFEDLTASKEFQSALQALSKTMGVLVDTALPLLGEALKTLGPVIEILAPPLQELIRHLGAELRPVIQKLGPVLESMAGAAVKVVEALSPFVDLALQLGAELLPVLTPLFKDLGAIFEQIAPVVEEFVGLLAGFLKPILAELPELVGLFLDPLRILAEAIFPAVKEALVVLAPSFEELGTAFGEVLAALKPLIERLLFFMEEVVKNAAPVLAELLVSISELVVDGLHIFASVLKNVVVPAIQIFTDLLNNDTKSATEKARELVQFMGDSIVKALRKMQELGNQAVSAMASFIIRRFGELMGGIVQAVNSGINKVLTEFGNLPGEIRSTLGDLGGLLFSAGADIVNGLISGLQSKLGELQAKGREIANTVKNAVAGLLGIHSPSRVMIEFGGDIVAGLVLGLERAIPRLAAAASDVALTIPQTIAQPVTALPLSGGAIAPQINVYVGNRRLNSHIDFRIDTSRRRETLELAHGRRR